jgi:hypothetical protein
LWRREDLELVDLFSENIAAGIESFWCWRARSINDVFPPKTDLPTSAPAPGWCILCDRLTQYHPQTINVKMVFFSVSVSCVTFSNPDSLSSSETVVNSGIKS